MTDMIKVSISIDTALELFENRLDTVLNWWSDIEYKKLYLDMYKTYLEQGIFENTELDVMEIVDNDVVNYCSIIHENYIDFRKLYKLYQQGYRDVSCEDFEEYSINYIEAYDDELKAFLVRY